MQPTTLVTQRWATEVSNRNLWTAPPRNHDWIAARIGRG
jgi:hypothetical protein